MQQRGELMNTDKKELYQRLEKLLNTQDLDKWAAEKTKPRIDEVIALVKRAVKENKEKSLVCDELQELKPFFISYPSEQFDEYLRTIRSKTTSLDGICLLQVLLPAKKLPSYEQATDKAIKKAEALIKKISMATKCNAETAGFLAELLIQSICHTTYYLYNQDLYLNFQNKSTEIATQIEAALNQITEPKKDTKNDKYYNERDRLMVDLNKVIEDLFASMYNYNKADRIAADIISELYPEQKIEEITALTTKIDSWPYFNIPNTPAIKITKQLINNPNRIQTTRRGQIKLIDYKTGNSDITYKGTDSNLVFTLERKKELFASKIQKGVKVFNFLLQKLNEQNKAEITTFQLDELVEKGIYANKDSARKGVKNILQKIFSIGIKGTVTEYQGRKRIEKSFGESRIIAAYEVKEKNTYVSFPLIIRANIPFYTLLPKWSYKLNDNAYMLLDYISILERQNAEEIKKTGCFNINLDAVRIYLGLPTPKNAGNDPRKLIFEPIEKAITEIEEKQEGTAFKITPCYDLEFKKIQTFLAGYLKIELDQPMREQLIKIANMQEYEYKLEKKRIEKARQEATNKAIESTTKEE